MPNRPGATPRLQQLMRVVPVVQTFDLAEGSSLTVVSLEIYAEGFLVHTQARHIIEARFPHDAHEDANSPATWRQANLASPELLFEATDDVGESYACWSSGGYGGGATPDEMIWRRDYVFAPPIGPDASALRLTVPAIEWVSYSAAQSGPMVVASQTVGWTLTVSIAVGRA